MPLQAAAQAHDMLLVVGAPVRLPEGLFIGAFVVMPDGTLELYTKHHLGAFRPQDSQGGAIPPPEDTVFAPGDRNPLVSVDGHVCAVSVCADSLHRSHPRSAYERGARTYFSSQFAIPGHLEFKIAVLQKHAERSPMTTVLSNFAGTTGGLRSAGGSGILSEQGDMLVQLDADGAGVAVALEEPGGWRTESLAL